jgi:hypothetical protein
MIPILIPPPETLLRWNRDWNHRMVSGWVLSSPITICLDFETGASVKSSEYVRFSSWRQTWHFPHESPEARGSGHETAWASDIAKSAERVLSSLWTMKECDRWLAFFAESRAFTMKGNSFWN